MTIQVSNSKIKLFILVIMLYSCEIKTSSILEVRIEPTQRDWTSINVHILNNSLDTIIYSSENDSYFGSDFKFQIIDNNFKYDLIFPHKWVWFFSYNPRKLMPNQKILFKINMIKIFNLQSDSDSLKIRCIFQDKFKSNWIKVSAPIN